MQANGSLVFSESDKFSDILIRHAIFLLGDSQVSFFQFFPLEVEASQVL